MIARSQRESVLRRSGIVGADIPVRATGPADLKVRGYGYIVEILA